MIEAARGTLRAALNHAMREELISRNVAELVTLPKARKKNRRRNSWTVDEARKFLEWSRNDNDPLYPLWVLILVLGLRKGEALGLIWPDGDWPHATRTAPLSTWNGSYSASADTRSRTSTYSRQTAAPTRCRSRRSAYGAANRQAKPRPGPHGRLAAKVHLRGKAPARVHDQERAPDRAEEHQPRPLTVRCKRAGVRRIKIHDTRRTCGSLLAALDVHPRVAMAILRHSRIALTMEIYTQVPDKVTRDALRRLSDQLDQADEAGQRGAEDGQRGRQERAVRAREGEGS